MWWSQVCFQTVGSTQLIYERSDYRMPTKREHNEKTYKQVIQTIYLHLSFKYLRERQDKTTNHNYGYVINETSMNCELLILVSLSKLLHNLKVKVSS